MADLAQTLGSAIANEPIGQVETLSGGVTVVHADGTVVTLNVGDPVFQGDLVETGSGGAVGIVLADQTTFSMAEDGRIVLDEMVYDPGTQEGSVSLSALEGVFTFVSGELAKTDPEAMTVETPMATIGIRGTQLGVDLTGEEGLSVVLMEEAGGYVGEVVVSNQAGVQVLNQAYQSTIIENGTAAPGAVFTVPKSHILSAFGSSLLGLPATPAANPYGLDEAALEELLEEAFVEEGGAEGDEAEEVAVAEEAGPEVAEFETAAGESEPEPVETIRVTGEEEEPAGFEAIEPVFTPPPVEPEPEPAPTVTETPRHDEITTDAGTIVVNTEPNAIDTDAETPEDNALSGQLTATDVDQDTLTFTLAADAGHGTVTVNADGTFSYVPDADWYGIDSFTFSVDDGAGGTDTATVTLNVGAVPDLPVLSIATASGAEDSAIALGIAADVPGTEALSEITITGVPDGAVLSLGTQTGDDTWIIGGADLDDLGSLTVTPPADFSGDMDLSVTATSTDGGIASAGMAVAVTPVPDLPVLTITAASGAEDSAISLSVAADVPGAEDVASITISGVPEGASLSAGADNGDGTWTLSPDDLDGLTISPPANSSADFNLSVTATSTDGGTASAGMTVAVAAVADIPTLDVSDISLGGGGLPTDDVLRGTRGEDTLVGGGGDDRLYGKGGADVLYGDAGPGGGSAIVPIDISAALTDTDASEVLSIEISGIPERATLSAGVETNGVWTLGSGDLDGLTLTLPEGHFGDFQLGVSAIATETDPDTGAIETATTSATIDVAYTGGGEAGDDYLRGGGGDDILYGGAGEDILKGDSGDDVLHGEAGDDRLYGGSGEDTLYGGAGEDELKGGGGEDTLFGGEGDDYLKGEGGEDVLHGGEGEDVLRGGGGEDTLFGGEGDDYLKGEGGEDVLAGGAGDDILRGGGGEDVFVFQSGAGEDTVIDYRRGEDLRFEGEDFMDAYSNNNYSVTQDGDDAIISFGDQNVQVTVEDVNAESYSVTPDPETGGLVVTFDDRGGCGD